MLSRRFKKETYLLRFRNMNSPCMRINTRVDVYEPSEDDYRLLMAKLDDMFLLGSGRNICAPQRDTNIASPYKAL